MQKKLWGVQFSVLLPFYAILSNNHQKYAKISQNCQDIFSKMVYLTNLTDTFLWSPWCMYLTAHFNSTYFYDKCKKSYGASNLVVFYHFMPFYRIITKNTLKYPKIVSTKRICFTTLKGSFLWSPWCMLAPAHFHLFLWYMYKKKLFGIKFNLFCHFNE